MIVCLTKKVQDLFRLEGLENYQTKQDDMWHVTTETFERKKLYYVVHVVTGYTLVYYGLTLKHRQRFSELLLRDLRTLMVFDGFTDQAAQTFIDSQGPIHYGKTNNRSVISNTTNRKHDSYRFFDELDKTQVFQKIISRRINHALGLGYQKPRELLDAHLSHMMQVTSSYRGYELDVILDLDQEQVIRRVLVPNYFTLDDLHVVIQKLFGWMDYHLHQFMNLSNHHIYAPLEDVFIVHDDTLNSRSMSVEDAFKDFDEWLYTYDFGDDWQHTIVCNHIVNQPQPIIPICTFYDGENVPEDVGGIHGYHDFKQVMSQETHEAYHEYQSWLASLDYEPFDLDQVNVRLLQAFSYGFFTELLRMKLTENKEEE